MVERLPVHWRWSRNDDRRLDDRPLRPPGGPIHVGELGGCVAAAHVGAWRPHRSFRYHAKGSRGRTMTSPLTSVELFHLGPVPITTGVVGTWAIMALLVAGGILITRHLSLVPSVSQAAFELIVDAVDNQIRD